MRKKNEKSETVHSENATIGELEKQGDLKDSEHNEADHKGIAAGSEDKQQQDHVAAEAPDNAEVKVEKMDQNNNPKPEAKVAEEVKPAAQEQGEKDKAAQ